MRVLVALGAFLAGVALGLMQPAFTMSIGVTVAAGPTWVGLIMLLSLFLAAISGTRAFVTRRPARTVPTFVLSGSLALGIIGGNVVGGVLDLGPQPPAVAVALRYKPRSISLRSARRIRLSRGSLLVRRAGSPPQ